MTTQIATAAVNIEPDFTGFRGAVAAQAGAGAREAGARAGTEAGQAFGASFKRTIGTALAAGAGFLAVEKIAEFTRESVKAAAEQKSALALVETAVKNAGAANTIYGQSIEEVIRKESLRVGIVDDQLLPAFSRLVQATHNSDRAYRDLQLAEDVARQRHIGVAGAALALAKAEQGNVTSLQRLGIIIPEHVRKLALAERATKSIAYVQQRFGGSAQAYAESGAGALERLGVVSQEIKEEVGAALLPEIEQLAGATADWLSNTENVKRVQADVHTIAEVAAATFKALAFSVEVVTKVMSPLVRAVGGVEHAVELAFGAVALRKVIRLGVAVRDFAVAQAASAAVVTASATAEAAAIEGVAAAEGVAGAAAAANAPKLLAFSNGMLLLEAGAVAAGFGLGTLAIKALGLEGPLKSLGGWLEGVAAKLGVVSDGLSDASQAAAKTLSDPGVQAKLRDAYEQTKGLPAFARDAAVQNLVGPGYTFNDARVFANARARQIKDESQFGLSVATAPGVVGTGKGGAARPTDLDYKIKLAEALATKTTSDEVALYTARRNYIDRRIAAIKRDADLTADEKKNLLRLEQERNTLQDAITSISDSAAAAAKRSADEATRKAEEARRAAEQAAQAQAAAYRQSLSDQELLLQLGVKRAELTAKNVDDDRRAQKKLIAYYKAEAKDAQLTIGERRQYAIQAIDAQLALRDIGKRKGAGATAAPSRAADFFREAAANFRAYGSNIAQRGGILSGQDARAAYASRVLSSSQAQSFAAAVAAAQARRDQQRLSEAQKQTALLRVIARGVSKYGTPGPIADSIGRARRTAKVPAG